MLLGQWLSPVAFAKEITIVQYFSHISPMFLSIFYLYEALYFTDNYF
jgi:hypothetical protein